MPDEIMSVQTINRLAELGEKAAAAQPIPQMIAGSKIPFIIVAGQPRLMPELIFNDHSDRPERIKASVEVLDPASFCSYYTLFFDPNSRVFAYEPEQSVLAVLDYHASGEGSPRWGQHRAKLTMRQSEEWRIWTGSNNKQFAQQQFAEFLEQNSIDITDPAPASIMEVARDLQATTQVEFGAGIRMQDGQMRFRYTETTKASVGSGQLAVPEQFTLSIPVFIGGEQVSMHALLRFRVKEGKLVIWYTLVRPEEVMRQAFLAARAEIAETLKIDIINGKP